jgi:hypothetical protein
MYTNRATINTTALANSGSNFTNDYYWSSTESGSSDAWIHHLSTGGSQVLDKSLSVLVRAVRAF